MGRVYGVGDGVGIGTSPGLGEGVGATVGGFISSGWQTGFLQQESSGSASMEHPSVSWYCGHLFQKPMVFSKH